MVNPWHRFRVKHQPFMVLITLILIFIFLYPFWETLVVSLSNRQFAESLGLKLWPHGLNIDSYYEVFRRQSIGLAFLNSFMRTMIRTLFALIVNYSAGYALAHKALPGRSIITFFAVFTMFFSGGLIPGYLNQKDLGMIGTHWAVILPGVAGVYNTLMIRNFVMALGPELEESAKVDGANSLQIMLRIILPLSGAVLAVVGLWEAVGMWNEWFGSMIYTPGSEMITLPILVRKVMSSVNSEDSQSMLVINGSEATSAAVRAATVIIATVPILCVYPFLQRYFVKGIMVGALKG